MRQYYDDKEEVERFAEAAQAGDASPGASETAVEKREYKDFEGKRRPVKKWLGIW